MTYELNNLPIRVIRGKRKTISIELKPDEILLKAPNSLSNQEINNFLNSKRIWIEKHWRIVQERRKELEQLKPFKKDEIREMAEKALIIIPEKVKHYASIIGVDYGRITIRNQRTRWGSCSSKGNLNFNCLLVLFPDEVMDYVVVHELCHRKHMDHSLKFYTEVERVLPEYRKWRKWLKENGGLYLGRLP